VTGIEKLCVWLVAGLPVLVAMEPWSRVLHGRVWHGPLFVVHRSHHRPRAGRFEWNDVLSGTHAPVAMALILFGCVDAGVVREIAFGVGLGMTLFGLSYVLVRQARHGRLPSALAKSAFLQRVKAAHLRHHHNGGRAPYGLFLGPWEAAEPRRRRHAASGATSDRASPAPQRATASGPSRAKTSR
jgi:beta-carotene 3-hydroxylase